MIPRVNIISRKASVVSVNGAGRSRGALSPSLRGLGGRAPLGKFLGSKRHLDLLEINLNEAKIIPVHSYTLTKINVNGGIHYNVKAKR